MKPQSAYIMNLESAYLYKDIQENNKLTSKNKDLAKLFSATIPYSLEGIRFNELFPDQENFYMVNKKQYTKKIINLTFDKDYYIYEETNEDIVDEKTGEIRKKKKKRIKANKKKIRKYFYTNGFKFDGIDYVFYKRGSGKAKNGYALYIQKEYRDKLINRSRIGLVFEEDEDVDLTSLLAYESLIFSGIDFTINLDPLTEIVIIDDLYGDKFKSKASVTREVNGKLVTKDEYIEIENCITDGQGLLDSSVFKEKEKEDKGFMLLRNDFFKCCAFNTKLSEWFEHNKVEKITDMFGNEYDASKVKLITTPNSFKFLKFAYKVSNKEDLEQKKECFDYYIKNIDSTFGVVKTDKEGNYGSYNRTTYQLLNSIPTLTYDDLMEISKQEREYVNLLKNDIAVFRHYLGCDVHASIELEENMESGKMEMYETADLMNVLMLVNSDFQYTKKFKDLRKNIISYYVKNLREGNMRLEGSKYLTLFSNPYEMLLSTIGKFDGKSIYDNEKLLKNREVYSPQYIDGQDFCVSRNPHILAGNVMWAKNKYRDEYKWFNITKNIVAINTFDNDVPDRLQGCDFDSDTAQFVTNPVLVEHARLCELNYTTPINKVKGNSKPRRYNMKELADLDIVLSDNYIGKIINLSQIINSYMNHEIQNDGNQNKVEALYHLSSRLSSMSQIEIDKSKKVFDNINMAKEISLIKKSEYIRYQEDYDSRGELVNKMICPSFFSMISDSNQYRILEKFDTPLDILQDVLDFSYKSKRLKNIDFVDLMVRKKKITGSPSHITEKAIVESVKRCGRKIMWTKTNTCDMSEEGKRIFISNSKNQCIEKVKSIKNNSNMVTYYTIRHSFGDKKDDIYGTKRFSMLLLSALYYADPLKVLNCFKSNIMENDEVLIKTIDGDIEIFGETYEKITRKELKKMQK